MRLPNGFGSVYKLSGNRRKPWVARKTTGWTFDEEKQKSYLNWFKSQGQNVDSPCQMSITVR